MAFGWAVGQLRSWRDRQPRYRVLRDWSVLGADGRPARADLWGEYHWSASETDAGQYFLALGNITAKRLGPPGAWRARAYVNAPDRQVHVEITPSHEG